MLTLIRKCFWGRHAANETSEKAKASLDHRFERLNETSAKVEAIPDQTLEQVEASLDQTFRHVETSQPELQLTYTVTQPSPETRRNARDVPLSMPDIFNLLAEVLPLADVVSLALVSHFFLEIHGFRLLLLNLPENAGQELSFLARFNWYDTHPTKILCMVCARYHS